MINANEAEDMNIAAADRKLEIKDEKEPSPRTKKALAGYVKHLEKSNEQLQLEFIDQRKKIRDKEAQEAEETAKLLAKQLPL